MSGYRGKRAARSRRGAVVLAAGIVAVLALIAAAVFSGRPRPEPTGAGPAPADSGARQDASGSTGTSSGAASSQADVQQPDASKADVPEPSAYDFSLPAPEGEPVDNSYFADAAFVGDSRTDGFMLYSGIGCGKNLTSNGLSIFSLPTKKALTIGGEKYTLLEALELEEYGKVYLSLGVNELGTYNDEGFYASYCDAIDRIRRVQPRAVIYIQGLIPLNEGQILKANGNKFNLTNEHLQVYNSLMKQVAEKKQVVFLDLYSEFVDENGELPEKDSRDGVHLVKEACQRWLDYLKSHTVEFEILYPDGLLGGEAGPEEEVTGETSADGSVQNEQDF